ncbi:hypothetical protein B0H14DRAFT_2636789 [Mycena olivaceomarginata]|nr:hypothetical protein B0H14DRAFT_2636789 [Mycena olivaceomarginata]
MVAWPILDGSSEADSEDECKMVLAVFWQQRKKVTSYQEFLDVRLWKDGSLTCSKAVASWGCDLPAPAVSEPMAIAAAGWGNTNGSGWGTDGGWGNNGGGWGNSSKPAWDGVTMFPRTRGKKRRQCRHRHMRWSAAEADAAVAAAADSRQLEQWGMACT